MTRDEAETEIKAYPFARIVEGLEQARSNEPIRTKADLLDLCDEWGRLAFRRSVSEVDNEEFETLTAILISWSAKRLMRRGSSLSRCLALCDSRVIVEASATKE